MRFRRTRKTATIKHLLQAGYLVQRFLPGTGVTHLHAHFAHSPASVAMFASCMSGLPFSFTAHAKDIYTSDPRQLSEKIGRARFVVTCTGYNRGYLAGLRPLAGSLSPEHRNDRQTPIYSVYHGIDLNLFSKNGAPQATHAPPAAGSGRQFQILTVARIIEKKGLPTVYRALRLLRDQGLDVRHTLIGSGDESESSRLLELVRELGLRDVARWAGTLPHEAVLDHYRRADLFVLGCQVAQNGDRDGIPNVLVESMAMGVPVVATQVSAIPELVQDGVTGLLVPPRSPEKLAAAMKRLLTDIPLRKQVITAAHQRVTDGFDNAVLIRELAAIYQKEGLGVEESAGP